MLVLTANNRKRILIMQTKDTVIKHPSNTYKIASLVTLAIGAAGYLLGLYNAEILLSEKGFYFAVFLLALFSAVSLQKTVRDLEEGIAVTGVFTTICWASFAASIALLVIGLINAQMLLSEKGFYAMSFLLSLFAVVTVQKNTRDLASELPEQVLHDNEIDNSLLSD